MKKTLTLFILTALVAASLLSCNGRKKEPDIVDILSQQAITGTVQAPEDTTQPPETTAAPASGDVLLKVISGVPVADLGGNSFTFCVRGKPVESTWYERGIFAGEDSSGVVSEAALHRNACVESVYNVKIVEKYLANSAASGKTSAEIRTDIMSGGAVADADVYAVSVKTALELADEGFLIPYSKIPYINLSGEWWDAELNSSLSVSGSVYAVGGDLSLNALCSTRVLFVNKSLLEALDTEDPYALAGAGLFTLDKMNEMASAASADVNSDGVRDERDCYGILAKNETVYDFLGAAGFGFSGYNSDGELVITIGTKKTKDVLARLYDVFYNTDVTYNVQSPHSLRTSDGVNVWMLGESIWKDGRALFFDSVLNNVARYSSLGIDYGILPYPKLETAEPYRSSCVESGPTVFVVPESNGDLDRTGLILEAMCILSPHTTVPAYISETASDERDAEMLGIITGSRIYDMAAIFNVGGIMNAFSAAVSGCDRDFSDNYADIADKVESELELLFVNN